MFRRPKRRTFRATLLRAVVMPALFGLALVVPAMTQLAPEAGWMGNPVLAEVERAGAPANLPTFAWVEGAPIARGCVAADAFPEGGIPSESVVVANDGTVSRVPFGVAWDAAKAAAPNTYWIVAACG